MPEREPNMFEFYQEIGQSIYTAGFADRVGRQPTKNELTAASNEFSQIAESWRIENVALLGRLAQVARTVRDMQLHGFFADARVHLDASVNRVNTFDPLFAQPGGSFLHDYVQRRMHSNEDYLAEMLKALIALGDTDQPLEG